MYLCFYKLYIKAKAQLTVIINFCFTRLVPLHSIIFNIKPHIIKMYNRQRKVLTIIDDHFISLQLDKREWLEGIILFRKEVAY